MPHASMECAFGAKLTTGLIVAIRELINRFEQKIQATFAWVWGEEKHHDAATQ